MGRRAREVAGSLGTGTQSASRLLVAASWMNSLRTKARVLGPTLSTEPPWRMLLRAYICMREGETPSVGDLCVASGAAPTLAARYLGLLERDGWLERVGLEAGGTTSTVRLTAMATASIEEVLDTTVLNSRRLGLARALLDG